MVQFDRLCARSIGIDDDLFGRYHSAYSHDSTKGAEWTTWFQHLNPLPQQSQSFHREDIDLSEYPISLDHVPNTNLSNLRQFLSTTSMSDDWNLQCAFLSWLRNDLREECLRLRHLLWNWEQVSTCLLGDDTLQNYTGWELILKKIYWHIVHRHNNSVRLSERSIASVDRIHSERCFHWAPPRIDTSVFDNVRPAWRWFALIELLRLLWISNSNTSTVM